MVSCSATGFTLGLRMSVIFESVTVMSVSSFEVSCDFPDCQMTIAHGSVRPPLLVGAFSNGVGQLLAAHRWTVDDEGRDMCALHPQPTVLTSARGTLYYRP
jgi:hypothetical protein